MKKHARFATAMAAACLAAAAVLLSSSNAEAHFTLLYPPPWITQDGLGDPQKAGPCGTDAQQPGTPTNDVTTFAPGQMITIHVQEAVAHDGWYRVSLSYANRTDLTDPPYQTYSSGLMAGWSEDAGIEAPPVPPVLLDGVDKHTAAQLGSNPAPGYDWKINLTLPTEPCAKCTLQVEEIMLNHPVNQADGPFTYHHCADISIVAGGDGGTTTKGADGGTVIVKIDSGVAGGGGTSSGTSSGNSSGTTGTGSSSGDTDASDGTGEGSDGGSGATSGGSGNNGASGSSGGSSGGCDAAGRGTTAVAGFGLLVGAIAAGIRRRRRRATN